MLRAMAIVRPIPSPLPIRIFKSAIAWSPVWVPAHLFWQISVGGLRPALARHVGVQRSANGCAFLGAQSHLAVLLLEQIELVAHL